MLPHRMALFARGPLRQDGRNSSIKGSGSFITTCTQVRFLAAALDFDNGSQTPTTEGAGRDPLLVERSYRRHESCEGGFQHHTS